MEIYKKIGSKERLFEMMQGVNKTRLNEDIMTSQSGFIDAAVSQLLNGSLDIEQVNNQVQGGQSTVEIVGKDENRNNFIFKFQVTSNETDQQGVHAISDANLIELSGDDGNFNVSQGDERIAEINKKYKEQLIDAVSEYVEFESDTETVDDEMYEEAIKFIDSVPYNKGSEEMQTHKAYADQKPTNPDVRVDADELQKFVTEDDEEEFQRFVTEIQDYVPDEEEDSFALPPDYSEEDLPKPADSDDGSVSTDPYDQQPEYDDEEASPEEQQLYSQAYDNLISTGNQAPTGDQIEREVLKLKGVNKPVEKTRTIPRGAEAFWEGQTMDDISTDTVVKQGFDKLLPEEKKKQYIFRAQQAVDEAIGDIKMPRESYIKNIQKEAIKLYKEDMIGVNEEEKGEYPDPIGKKFKPKNQMPKKKRKPQSVVNIKEEEPHESGAYLQDGMPGERDRNAHPIPSVDPNFTMGEPKEDQPEIDIEDVSTAKEATGDQLGGGLADDSLPNQFDPEQIAKGVKVEMEHTDNPLLAIEIAMDHLTEDPNYYGGADDDPEDMAQIQASGDAEELEDKETTDELLGYKPHNVSDYTNEEFDVPESPEQERNYWDKEDMKQNPEEHGEEPQDSIEESELPHGEQSEMEVRSYDEAQRIGFAGILNFLVNRRTNKIEAGFIGWNVPSIYTSEYTGPDNDSDLVLVSNDELRNPRPYLEFPEGIDYTKEENWVKQKSIGSNEFDDQISESQVKLARQVLKNRRLNEGMSKQEAVQILIKNNIK